MSVAQLVTRLEKIEEACKDPKAKKKKEQEEKEMDDFTRMKKKISNELKEARKAIEERNELLGKHENNTATAKMSQHIRNRMKGIVTDTEQLKSLVEKDKEKIEKKKAKNKKVEEKFERETEAREEIVKLIYSHIDECKHLERSGYGNNNTFQPTSAGPVVSELPDIPDDEGFQLLKKNNTLIDKKLDAVSDGVQVLRGMAEEMGKEIEMQGSMIGELGKKMDDTQGTLDNLNRRLRNTLEKVRKADRFCIDIILLIVILAIGAYVYNLFRKK